jgi:hypothetical protein
VLVVLVTGDMHAKFWQGNLGGRRVDNIKWIYKKEGGREWTGFIWFSVEASDGIFWKR